MNLFFKKKFLFIFILIIITLSLIIGSVGYLLYTKEQEKLKDKTAQHYNHLLNQQKDILLAHFTPAISNISFLSKLQSVIDFIDSPENIEKLKYDLQKFTESNRDFKQVRLLDVNGMEKIRFNRVDDSINYVEDRLLQNKSHRFYFSESVKLKPNEIYISPIDLNIENKKIEVPFQKVIRFTTPIFDHNGDLKGIIVINQYLNELFSKLEKHNFTDEGDFMLLNNNGYWLFSEKHKSFGFMVDSLKNEKLASYYPETWNKIANKINGEIYTKEGFFIFRKFTFRSDILSKNIKADNSNNWFLAVHIPPEKLGILYGIPKIFFLVSIFSAIFIFLISYIISSLRFKEIKYIENLNELNATLEDKIKKRTAQLTDKNQELQKLNDELESFSYSVSHDLNAPLLHIKLFIELIFGKTKDEVTPNIREYLENIKNESENMKQMIQDMLSLSRFGRAKLNYTTFETEVLVKEVIRNFSLHNQDRKINWKISDLPKICGDISLLRQVWINLISNAIKFSSQKEVSEIEITATEDKEHYIFSVSDNGVGFRQEDSERLFKSFSRTHSAKNFEGNGIGLSIVKRIIDNHKGEIRAESKDEGGACFIFTIPKKTNCIKKMLKKEEEKTKNQYIYT